MCAIHIMLFHSARWNEIHCFKREEYQTSLVLSHVLECILKPSIYYGRCAVRAIRGYTYWMFGCHVLFSLTPRPLCIQRTFDCSKRTVPQHRRAPSGAILCCLQFCFVLWVSNLRNTNETAVPLATGAFPSNSTHLSTHTASDPTMGPSNSPPSSPAALTTRTPTAFSHVSSGLPTSFRCHTLPSEL